MRFLTFILLFLLSNTSFGQFVDTNSLKTYIQQTIRDKRPEKVTAEQIQASMLGTIDVLSSYNSYNRNLVNNSGLSVAHNNRGFNYTVDSLGILRYNFPLPGGSAYFKANTTGVSIGHTSAGEEHVDFKFSSAGALSFGKPDLQGGKTTSKFLTTDPNGILTLYRPKVADVEGLIDSLALPRGGITSASNGLSLTGPGNSNVTLGGSNISTNTNIIINSGNTLSLAHVSGSSSVITIGSGQTTISSQASGAGRSALFATNTGGEVYMRSYNSSGADAYLVLGHLGTSVTGPFNLLTNAGSTGAYNLLVKNTATNQIEHVSGLPGSIISTGLVAPARLGTGTANNTTALFGDQTYKSVLTAVPSWQQSMQVSNITSTTAIVNATANASYALEAYNAGSTNAGGLYVSTGPSSTGNIVRFAKNGDPKLEINSGGRSLFGSLVDDGSSRIQSDNAISAPIYKSQYNTPLEFRTNDLARIYINTTGLIDFKGGTVFPIVSISEDLVVTDQHHTIKNVAVGGNPLVSLPDPVTNKGRILILIEEAANSTADNMNFDYAGTGVLYKGSFYRNFNNPTLSSKSRLTIQSDGTNWLVIAGM